MVFRDSEANDGMRVSCKIPVPSRLMQVSRNLICIQIKSIQGNEHMFSPYYWFISETDR